MPILREIDIEVTRDMFPHNVRALPCLSYIGNGTDAAELSRSSQRNAARPCIVQPQAVARSITIIMILAYIDFRRALLCQRVTVS
jgi:hypothetical protein